MNAICALIQVVVSFACGADVFIEPDGGPLIGLYRTDDATIIDVHLPVQDAVTGKVEYRGCSDYAISRAPATGIIYVQRAWWKLEFDWNNNPKMVQDFWFWTVWFPN